MTFRLTSTAFEDGQSIPRDHTAEGRNVSPTLKWTDPPEATTSFALIVEDPDAPRGTFTHWVIFNIPAEARELGEGVPHKEGLANGTLQGSNGFHRIGYSGPKPPPGWPHRYEFKLYALDRRLDLHASATRDEVCKAMKGHVLAEAVLTGIYEHGHHHEIPDDPIKKKALQDRASLHTPPLV